MLSPEGEDEEFEFYLKIAKPLVLNLPNTNDRIKAAAWVRYLKNNTTDSALRGEYLKLLLFVLQRRRLFGPFASIPDESKPLPKFPEEINIQDVAKNYVEVDKKILKQALERDRYDEWPPYSAACSADFREYVAQQEIPNFGVHAYFALSKDPMPQWDHFQNAVFPLGESIDTTNPDNEIMDTTSPDISCFVSHDQYRPVSAGLTATSPRTPHKELKDKSHSKSLEDVALIAPKEPCAAKEEDVFNMDARQPPSWGSNLVHVKDSPSLISHRPLGADRDLDSEVSEQDMIDFFNEDSDLYDADSEELANNIY